MLLKTLFFYIIYLGDSMDVLWELAEKINQIDGLDASLYLKELIEKEKAGLITTEEIIELLKKYYGEIDERYLH